MPGAPQPQAFLLPANDVSPTSDLEQDRDIRLIPGTPMLSNKPALVLWMKSPRSAENSILTTVNINLTPYELPVSYHTEITGIALVISNKALLSGTNQVLNISDLPPALSERTFKGSPIRFVLYGSTLTPRDYSLILLTGTLFSLLMATASWLLLSKHQRPGKEIILGIKRGQFHVEYQPIIAAEDGKPYGVEALLRWTHPTEGRIPPDSFISHAEAQNLIIPLMQHLFQLVARDAKYLCQQLPYGTCISLNLSPIHLASDHFRQHVLA